MLVPDGTAGRITASGTMTSGGSVTGAWYTNSTGTKPPQAPFLLAMIQNHTMMKKLWIILILTLLGTAAASAQTVYAVNYKSDAQVKVYVAKYKSDADLVVYKCQYKSDAEGNKGLWHFVNYKSDAKKTIYFVDYKSDADLVIFFTDYKSDAGWRRRDKQHLMY